MKKEYLKPEIEQVVFGMFESIATEDDGDGDIGLGTTSNPFG